MTSPIRSSTRPSRSTTQRRPGGGWAAPSATRGTSSATRRSRGASSPVNGWGGSTTCPRAGALTWVIGQFMSQRTPNGAYVDAMLKAFRRTLQKTMEQARSMEQVVADPTVKLLADTPDKAVVWGFALGLHDDVAKVLQRTL